ncbi:MAG: AzlD domain-containing protein [Pseudomonadota bacterium]
MSEIGLWSLIIGLGITTYLIRFSFLGMLSGRQLPNSMMRALSFVPVTVLPALVAPMILMDEGRFIADPPRIVAALVGLAIGAMLRHVFAAIAAAMITFAVLRAAGL